MCPKLGQQAIYYLQVRDIDKWRMCLCFQQNLPIPICYQYIIENIV